MQPGILNIFDYLVMGLFIGFLIFVGIFRAGKSRTFSDFFIAGRKLSWPLIGFSMFASNISAQHLVGLAGAGYRSGFLYGNFEWMSAFNLLILAFIFAPYYLYIKVITMPEFIGKRYGTQCRDFLGWMNVFIIVFIRMSAVLYAGGLFIHALIGWPLQLCILILSIIAASYTFLGGLATIVVTGSFSACVMIFGSLLLTIIGLTKIGGVSELVTKVPDDFWSMLRPPNDPEMSWYSIVFGYPVMGIWFWCTDQVMVQRVLGARNLEQGQLGAIFTGFLKILPVFIIILPGIICHAIYPNLPNNDLAFPTMIVNWLPTGMRGFMITILILAVVSTTEACLNSLSTIFTLDIFKKWSPQANQNRLLWVGRISTIAAMIIAIIWAPIYGKFPKGIFNAIVHFNSWVAPPITAVFLLGILSKKVTPRAATLTLWLGTPICIMTGVFELLDWPSNLWPLQLNFMFLSFVLLLGLVLFMIVISALTNSKSIGLELPTLKQVYINYPNLNTYRLAFILIAILFCLYFIFG